VIACFFASHYENSLIWYDIMNRSKFLMGQPKEDGLLRNNGWRPFFRVECLYAATEIGYENSLFEGVKIHVWPQIKKWFVRKDGIIIASGKLSDFAAFFNTNYGNEENLQARI
jgi:hypothetical protein